MALKQSTALAAALVFATVVASGPVNAESPFEPPADAQTRTALSPPPPTTPILVPIERRVFRSNIVTRGIARLGPPQEQEVSPEPSVLKQHPGPNATVSSRTGEVREGSVLRIISGRPVFVLQGRIPAYRDLVPSLSGNDVLQLEQALARLGFSPGAVDGIYDQSTAEAVARWYSANHWEPFGPARAQISALNALAREASDANKASTAAETAATAATQGVDAARAAADLAVKTATADLADKRSNASRVVANGKSIALAAAQARAAHANNAATAEYEAQLLERARVVLDPRLTETARQAADAKLDRARAAALKTRAEGEAAIQVARREAQLAMEQVTRAEATLISAQFETRRSVQSARDAQKLTEFEKVAARIRADRLEGELQTMRRRIRVQVPLREIVFLPSLPVRSAEIPVVIGGASSTQVPRVTGYKLAVDSALTLHNAPLVKPGMSVTIDEPSRAVSAQGVVAQVASVPGTRGVDDNHVYFEVHGSETVPELDGVKVQLTILTEAPVLAVPTSALSLAADGSSRIQIQDKDELRYVAVKPGVAAEGFVEVTPVNDTLEAGQLVVVGYPSQENTEKTDLQ